MARKITEEEKYKIREMYNNGLSTIKIGKILGRPQPTIWHIVARNRTDYLEEFAKNNGYSSIADYQAKVRKRNKDKPINKILSEVLKLGLKESELTIRTASQSAGFSEGAFGSYTRGESFPSTSETLYKVLNSVDRETVFLSELNKYQTEIARDLVS